jgi:hypothetical protein
MGILERLVESNNKKEIERVSFFQAFSKENGFEYLANPENEKTQELEIFKFIKRKKLLSPLNAIFEKKLLGDVPYRITNLSFGNKNGVDWKVFDICFRVKASRYGGSNYYFTAFFLNFGEKSIPKDFQQQVKKNTGGWMMGLGSEIIENKIIFYSSSAIFPAYMPEDINKSFCEISKLIN